MSVLIQERSKEELLNIFNDTEYCNIVEDILNNETVQEMRKYRQHYNTSTYDHCLEVSYISYKICKKLKLDYKSMARAAMLHDLFLYDWRKSQRDVEIEGLHAFVHPYIALKNASKLFDLNEKEKDIIVKHMWPVTLPLPRYKETFVIIIIDKYCALHESYIHYKNLLLKKFVKNGAV